MKFAMACDSVVAVNSYYVRDKKVFTFDDKPYLRHHHLSNECLMGVWNYPFLFDGYFINLQQQPYPDEDFDVIFCAIENDIGYLNILRKTYPNAKLVGSIKEMIIPNRDVRQRLIQNTDAFVVPYISFDYYKEFNYETPSKSFKIPQPVNIDYLRNNYLVEKQNVVFDYENYWAAGRLPRNKEVLDKIDYKVESLHTNSWEDCINSWKHCKFLFNLDTTLNVGQQAIQSAALENIVLGGNNDAHKLLFPELSGMDVDKIVSEFNRLVDDEKYYHSTIKYASKKLREIYSLESVKQQVIKLKESLDG